MPKKPKRKSTATVELAPLPLSKGCPVSIRARSLQGRVMSIHLSHAGLGVWHGNLALGDLSWDQLFQLLLDRRGG